MDRDLSGNMSSLQFRKSGRFGFSAIGMKRVATLSILVAGAFLATWLLKDSGHVEPFVVSQEGRYVIGEKAEVHVFKAKNGLLNLNYSSGGFKMQWKDGFIDPSKDWNIYVQNRNEIWLIEDNDVSYIHDLGKSSGAYGLFSCGDPTVLNEFIFERMPEKVTQLLPEKITQRVAEARQQGKILKRDKMLMEAFAQNERGGD